MATRLEAPTGVGYDPLTSTSIMLRWVEPSRPIGGHEMRCGSPIVRKIEYPARTAVVQGLPAGRATTLELRAYDGSQRSEWVQVQVRSSEPIPTAPTTGVSVIQLIDADRQSVQMRLPRPDGTIEDVKLYVWWSPSDAGWWGAIEVPVNTPTLRSRNLPLNVGLFDDVEGILAGNIVMRSTQDGGADEPDRMSFVNQTHQLRWEPA